MSAPFQLTVNHLRKDFGNRTVLDADGLQLESGRTYALVGPNGCGKSTFLRVLSGVADQTDGFVDIAGATRDSLSVGFMPQKSYVFGFSVFKNVALALSSSGLTRAQVDERVNNALSAVGMSALAQERGSGLSGGEAQRVALARMLAQDLDVLLLDEPTASMDIEGTLLVEQALAAYRERTACLLVVATHAPSQARRIAADVVMLSSGRVVEFGPTAQILEHPQSDEGRAFLSYWTV